MLEYLVLDYPVEGLDVPIRKRRVRKVCITYTIELHNDCQLTLTDSYGSEVIFRSSEPLCALVDCIFSPMAVLTRSGRVLLVRNLNQNRLQKGAELVSTVRPYRLIADPYSNLTRVNLFLRFL